MSGSEYCSFFVSAVGRFSSDYLLLVNRGNFNNLACFSGILVLTVLYGSEHNLLVTPAGVLLPH